MADLVAVLDDLRAESLDLDAVVSALPAERWATPTPADGWTIAHQVAHLAWTDAAARLAVCDPPAFAAELHRAAEMIDTYVDTAAAEGSRQPPHELLASWRDGRAALAEALRELPDGARIAWFGPPMGAASMATARLMETWAHGQDVYDALELPRAASPRLRHVAHIGVRTRDFAFLVRDLPVPAQEFRVELTAPDGQVWAWGPADAEQRVAGPALDFCLRVTQRRNRADLALVAHGAQAETWLDIAQAFAGPPGPGRQPAGASR